MVQQSRSKSPPTSTNLTYDDADEGAALRRAVLGALSQPIDRPRVSLMYQLALGGVAIAMILLPVVYVGLIVTVGWATLAGLAGIASSEMRGRAVFWSMALVGVTGGIVTLFMIKPLFAPKQPQPKPHSLRRDDQPLLFDFVDRLCQVVGAPKPRRIDVDCQVNASASFRRGVWSMFGRDLVLTIGLPLAAGLSLRELAGVLAHEFGHFAQGTGMRLTYLIRSVNHWFARVVYERDAWDQKLIDWTRQAGDAHFGAAIVLLVARGAVWLSRRLLWMLMWVGHAISCIALRQMEYDADAYETRVAGSDAFESTSLALPLLSVASQAAFDDLDRSWAARRLGDDLPALIVARYRQIDNQIRGKIVEQVLAAKTGVFETHPATRDRIAHARTINSPGSFSDVHPPTSRRIAAARAAAAEPAVQTTLSASAAFNDFPRVCRDATLAYYRQVLGNDVSEKNLVPTAALVQQHADEGQASEALTKLFGPTIMAIRPVFPATDKVASAEDEQAVIRDLRKLIGRMRETQDAAAKAATAVDEADSRLIDGLRVETLIKAGFRINRVESLQLDKVNETTLRQVHVDARRRMEELAPIIDGHVKTGMERIETALRLIETPTVAAKMADKAPSGKDVNRMLAALRAIRIVHDDLVQARTALVRLAILFHNLEGNESNASLVTQARSNAGFLCDRLKSVRGVLRDVRYPFEHADGRVSLADYAVAALPDSDQVFEVYRNGEQMVNLLLSLYLRILSQLAQVSLSIEAAVLDAPNQAAAASPAQADPMASVDGGT